MSKRPIFEEVSEPAPRRPAPAQTGLLERGQGARRAVRAWLIGLFLLVTLMVAVGGLTRLTGSGLSITEWRPITGALPPLSAEEWQKAFDAYRQTDQYRLVNQGMTLAEFKVIFWWEWGHRQLGRLIGLVWAAGFAWFLLLRQIPPGWTERLLALGLLGGLQGAIGWWMVASGLEEGMIRVASYRLAVHLGLAFAILGLIAWYVFLLGKSEAQLLAARRAGEERLARAAGWLAGLVFVQILLGALVAGIDAGRGYTDWPLMAGGLFPPGMWDLTPFWRNVFENDGTVQFIHRKVGYLVLIAALFVWLKARRLPQREIVRAAQGVLAVTVWQVVLGIITVLHAAPWALALLHQLSALALFVAVLWLRFTAVYPLGTVLRSAK